MYKSEFKILNNYGPYHFGEIKFRSKKTLNTPLIWFGLSVIEPMEFQLEVFKRGKIEAFLSNAFDLYYHDYKKKRENLVKKLQGLDLGHKMDSGGFQLMKKSMNRKNIKFKLTPQMVLEKQTEIGCDCGVQLDFPLGPNLNNNEKIRRIDKTINYLDELINLIDSTGEKFTILPVLHGDNYQLIKYALNKITEILGDEPSIIGVGSLVPLVKKIKGSRQNGIKTFIKIVYYLRTLLPKAFIHTFGIGGTMAYLAILAGVDSFDSNGWIQKAAYGVIQLPGISDRFLKKESHNRPFLIRNRKQRNYSHFIDEIDMFMHCKCEACLDFYKDNWIQKDWKNKQRAFSGYEQHSKLLRAIHNVSLYQSEIVEIRKAIQNNKLQIFIKKRLRFSRYYKYIKFFEDLKKNNIKVENRKETKILKFL